jgi:hypothetical protein
MVETLDSYCNPKVPSPSGTAFKVLSRDVDKNYVIPPSDGVPVHPKPQMFHTDMHAGNYDLLAGRVALKAYGPDQFLNRVMYTPYVVYLIQKYLCPLRATMYQYHAEEVHPPLMQLPGYSCDLRVGFPKYWAFSTLNTIKKPVFRVPDKLPPLEPGMNAADLAIIPGASLHHGGGMGLYRNLR